jgi:signal transduction histidine kinase/DNA-binding response OmpR family regulator
LDKTLHILHLEDNDNDAVLVRRALVRAELPVEVDTVATEAEFERALQSRAYDLIMSDNRVPGYDGIVAFRRAQQEQPRTPFMFVTGTLSEERMMAGIELRMPEFVSKSHLDELGNRIRAMLERPEETREHRLILREAAFDRLLEALRSLSLAPDLPKLATAACRAARQVTAATGASFILREGSICHCVEEDSPVPLLRGRKVPVARGIAGWVVSRGETAVIDDIGHDERVDQDVYADSYVRSLAMAPVGGPDALGAIGVYWSRRGRPAAEEVRLLRALADHAAAALQVLRRLQASERETREQGGQLTLAKEELQTFSQAVTGNLGAPLRTVGALGGTLLEEAGSGLPDAARQRVERIQAGIAGVNAQLDILSGLARVVQQDLHEGSVDLSAVAKQVVEALQAGEPERKVEVRIVPDLQVRGDAGLLTLALRELLGNAWKFTRRNPFGRIEFAAEPGPGEEPVYFVRDNGVGFDPRNAGKLFSPLERLHDDPALVGHGIGLASAQRALRKHGGRVWATGAVDRGATFYFTLPERSLRA